MVSLGYQESKNDVQTWNHICEGSILSDRIIITSGDCLDNINEDMIINNGQTNIKDVETKLQIRVGDEDINDDDNDDDDDDDDDDNDDDHHDDDAKVYFSDGFRKHESNVALIATNETIKFNDRVNIIGLPQENARPYRQAVDLAMWNSDGELENDRKVTSSVYCKVDYNKDGKLDIHDETKHCAEMKTCKGSGAALVKNHDKTLIGILGKANPSCENEIKIERKFAKLTHPEVLNFIKDSKKDLELCQSLKDCFCELRDLRC